MSTRARAAALAAVVVLALAFAAGVRAAPTLGGRLAPATIVYERQPWVAVTNLSSLPVTVTIEATDGWAVEDPTMTLDVGERGKTAITAAPDRDATITATLTPSDVLSGIDYSTLVLSAKARHLAPWESLDGPWWLIFALAALVTATGVWRRLRRRDRGLAR